ncbi:MAG: PhnD/SsuA/transferrin family substrate-binding protein, partial [Acetobacteraceae bacterium]|nr:PhnD/SsuA/transferrin family substrate-binding protein [Acetobacteraceae bacterium]
MIHRRQLLAASAVLPFATTAMAQETRAMPKKGKRPWAAQVPTIRMGLLGGENDADRLARYTPYQKLLEEIFEIPVKLVMAADYAGVIQAFAAKQVDASYMSPVSYAQAWL